MSSPKMSPDAKRLLESRRVYKEAVEYVRQAESVKPRLEELKLQEKHIEKQLKIVRKAERRIRKETMEYSVCLERYDSLVRVYCEVIDKEISLNKESEEHSQKATELFNRYLFLTKGLGSFFGKKD